MSFDSPVTKSLAASFLVAPNFVHDLNETLDVSLQTTSAVPTEV